MLQSAFRTAPRRAVASKYVLKTAATRRFLSTAPPHKKSRSWKGSLARWGLVGAGVYYYNTSNLFADEPEAAIHTLDDSLHHVQDSNLPTVEAIVEEKRMRQAQAAAEQEKREHEQAAKAVSANSADDEGAEGEGGMDGLEDEAGQQGAFNPETGEINWDCPCLGGMAHGPCGEEFKAAFSCFVYSKEEPKGVECIEKFKGMQDCFREHPEMYASELEDDEEEVEEELRSRGLTRDSEKSSSETESPPAQKEIESKPQPRKEEESGSGSEAATQKKVESKLKLIESHRDSQTTTSETAQHVGDEGGKLLPRASHDASETAHHAGDEGGELLPRASHDARSK